jgi:hypothetical protein
MVNTRDSGVVTLLSSKSTTKPIHLELSKVLGVLSLLLSQLKEVRLPMIKKLQVTLIWCALWLKMPTSDINDVKDLPERMLEIAKKIAEHINES